MVRTGLLSAMIFAGMVSGISGFAHTAAAEPLEIVHTTWVGYGPLDLARDLGYFEEEGVDVKLTTIEEKSLQMAAVMSGNVAAAAGTVDEFLLYMKPDSCLKYVLALDESSGGDGILVRDANLNGTVDNAGEFVFGGDGVTDMEALHAQYGDQLDASDADFTMFAVWNDANSNGVVDGNELQSLAEAGITSIGLVSDGIAYSAANGDVQVAGTASYTRADGSTGDAADASFSIGAAKSTQEVERVAANSNNVALAAAVAAAGFAVTPAAAEAPSFDTGDSFVTNALVGQQSFGDVGIDTAYGNPAFEFGNAWDSGFAASAQALSGSLPR